jgi:hypothetical protein
MWKPSLPPNPLILLSLSLGLPVLNTLKRVELVAVSAWYTERLRTIFNILSRRRLEGITGPSKGFD